MSIQSFWAIRENVPVSLMSESRKGSGGRLFKYDVSMALGDMSLAVSQVQSDLQAAGFSLVAATADPNICAGAAVDAAAAAAGNTTQHTAIATGRTGLEGRLDFCCFGHAADQNLHLNVLLRGHRELDGDGRALSANSLRDRVKVRISSAR